MWQQLKAWLGHCDGCGRWLTREGHDTCGRCGGPKCEACTFYYAGVIGVPAAHAGCVTQTDLAYAAQLLDQINRAKALYGLPPIPHP